MRRDWIVRTENKTSMQPCPFQGPSAVEELAPSNQSLLLHQSPVGGWKGSRERWVPEMEPSMETGHQYIEEYGVGLKSFAALPDLVEEVCSPLGTVGVCTPDKMVPIFSHGTAVNAVRWRVGIIFCSPVVCW